MTISQFNVIEAGFWLVFSVVIFARSTSHPHYKKVMSTAALTFLMFAVSDIIEAQTGAWWRPWWLLLIKSACVLSLVVCFVRYKQLRAMALATEPVDSKTPPA